MCNNEVIALPIAVVLKTLGTLTSLETLLLDLSTRLNKRNLLKFRSDMFCLITLFFFYSEMSTQLEHCRICKRNVEDDSHYTIITQKGAAGINQSSQMRRDTVVVTAGQKVHELCRKNYTHRRNIDNDTQRRQDERPAKISTAKCELRSSTSQFRFNECCLFCGCPVDLSA